MNFFHIKKIGFNTETAKAHRFCMDNGSWYRTHEPGTNIWDHRLECNPIDEQENSKNVADTESEVNAKILSNVNLYLLKYLFVKNKLFLK